MMMMMMMMMMKIRPVGLTTGVIKSLTFGKRGLSMALRQH